jgi:hypothetical protein
LRDSSFAAGKRLLDVLDLHWYPDLYVPIINENTDSATVFNRMQVPRSLWDSSYVENGWIGQWYHPQSAAILRKTQRIIAQQYPGTKLAVTEFNYGGSTHISGAVAMADVLGIFAANRVYFSSLWGDLTGYIASAYRMYRNYDGNGGTLGDLSVHAISSDDQNSAVHAAVNTKGDGSLHIVAINRSSSHSITGQFVINSSVQYSSATAFAVLPGSQQIQTMPGVGSIRGNQFTYSLPAMSVFHFVLSSAPTMTEQLRRPAVFVLGQNYPNPFNSTTLIDFTLAQKGYATVKLYNVLGQEVETLFEGSAEAGETNTIRFDGSNLGSGVYFYRLTAGSFVDKKKMLLLR